MYVCLLENQKTDIPEGGVREEWPNRKLYDETADIKTECITEEEDDTALT